MAFSNTIIPELNQKFKKCNQLKIKSSNHPINITYKGMGLGHEDPQINFPEIYKGKKRPNGLPVQSSTFIPESKYDRRNS